MASGPALGRIFSALIRKSVKFQETILRESRRQYLVVDGEGGRAVFRGLSWASRFQSPAARNELDPPFFLPSSLASVTSLGHFLALSTCFSQALSHTSFPSFCAFSSQVLSSLPPFLYLDSPLFSPCPACFFCLQKPTVHPEPLKESQFLQNTRLQLSCQHGGRIKARLDHCDLQRSSLKSSD